MSSGSVFACCVRIGVSISCCLAVAGCGQAPAPQGAATQQQPSKSETADDGPDGSLTADKYVEAGMPSIDQSWSAVNMSRASDVLTLLSQRDTRRLPRSESAKSGAVFARLTADDNLDAFRDESVPLEKRMQDGMTYSQSLNSIVRLYQTACKKGEVGSLDVAGILAAQLKLWVVVAPVIDAFAPTLDKSSFGYGVKMQGLERLRGSLATAVTDSVDALSERPQYEPDALKRLLRSMQATFPELLPQVPEAGRKETLARLKSFGSDPQMADLNPELSDLLERVEKPGPSENP